ncbi:hypothetical protein SAHY_16524 [Salinisphaera hydrothermalis EPR70]
MHSRYFLYLSVELDGCEQGIEQFEFRVANESAKPPAVWLYLRYRGPGARPTLEIEPADGGY